MKDLGWHNVLPGEGENSTFGSHGGGYLLHDGLQRGMTWLLLAWSSYWIKIRSYDDRTFFSRADFQGLLDGDAVFTVPISLREEGGR